MSNVKFAEGIRAFKPSDKAPDFIKASLLINKEEMKKYLSTPGNEIRLSVKESKKGTWYVQEDDYKPAAAASPEVDDLPF